MTAEQILQQYIGSLVMQLAVAHAKLDEQAALVAEKKDTPA